MSAHASRAPSAGPPANKVLTAPPRPPELTIALARQVQAARREAATASLEVFCRTYLPHYFTLPLCQMHRHLIGELERASTERSRRLAIAAPRGYGKTSLVAIAYSLWSIVCRGERHVLLALATQEDRREALETIRAELDGNRLLRQDHPKETQQVRRSLADIQTAAGSRLAAIVRLGRVRGRRHAGSPPTLVILDELERPEEEGEESWLLASRLEAWADEWMRRDLAPGANVVVVGSIVRERSWLTDLVDCDKRHEWTKLAFQAERRWPGHPDLWDLWKRIYLRMATHEGATGPDAARTFYLASERKMRQGMDPLWPAKADGYDLQVLKASLGEERFECEMQSDPIIKGENWRTARPLDCGSYYDRTIVRLPQLIDDTQTHWRFVAFDPDLDLPLAGRAWPDMARVEVDKQTGKVKFYAWDPHRRRIHSRMAPGSIRMAAERRAKGLPLILEEERAVIPPPDAEGGASPAEPLPETPGPA